MIHGNTDNFIVYIRLPIFSNSQLMSVINSVPIYKYFHVSWYTKQSSDVFNGQQLSTYTDEVEPISTW